MKVYEKTTLRRVASGFALADCIIFCLLIIPMCWMIPMTVCIRKDIRNNKPIPLALSICFMIFGGLFSMIVGILLIVDYGTNLGKEVKGGDK